MQYNSETRHEGCRTKLEDNGVEQSIPVCMGGVAIVGCNNYEQCGELYAERREDDGMVHVVHRNQDDIPTHVTAVPRAPLVL